MAITKTTEIPKIEVVGTWNIQVATDTVIKEDNTEIGRSRHRHVLTPCTSSKDSDDKWTHTDTDISGEDASVRAVRLVSKIAKYQKQSNDLKDAFEDANILQQQYLQSLKTSLSNDETVERMENTRAS